MRTRCDLLRVYDNIICVVFLIDFALNLRQASSKSEYFFRRRGWLDLIGSIPSLGILRFTALFRLARLSRLARIMRLLRGQKKKELIEDVVHNRGQYALFITVLSAVIVMTVSSVLVLQFESQRGRQHPDRRRRAVVGAGHDHHGRLWRLLPGHRAGSADGSDGHVRRRRHHRRPGQHPGQPARCLPRKRPLRPRSRRRPRRLGDAMARELAEIRQELALLRQALVNGGRPDVGLATSVMRFG